MCIRDSITHALRIAAYEYPYAGEEFVKGKGFYKVVVSSGVKSCYPVVDLSLIHI